MTEPRKIGRPSSYSRELAEEICNRMIEGKSILSISKEEDMPLERTIYFWLAGRGISAEDHEIFVQMYTRAREGQADHFAAQTIDIVDEEKDAAKARNRMIARQWYAEKLNPRKYGAKVQMDGNVNVTNDLSTMELARRLGFILTQGALASGTQIEGEAVEVTESAVESDKD